MDNAGPVGEMEVGNNEVSSAVTTTNNNNNNTATIATTTTPMPIPTSSNLINESSSLPPNITPLDLSSSTPDNQVLQVSNTEPVLPQEGSSSDDGGEGNVMVDLPPIPAVTTTAAMVTTAAAAEGGEMGEGHAPPLNALNTAEIDAIVDGFAGGVEGKTPMTGMGMGMGMAMTAGFGEGDDKVGLTPMGTGSAGGSGSGSGSGSGLAGWNGFMGGRPSSSTSVSVTGESMGMGKIPDESNRSARALSGHGEASVGGTSSSLPGSGSGVGMGMGSRGTDSPLPPINPNQPGGPIQLPRILSQSPAPGQGGGGPFAPESSSNGPPPPPPPPPPPALPAPPMMMGRPNGSTGPHVRPINTNVGPMSYPSQGLPGMQHMGPGGSIGHPSHYPPIPLPYPGNGGPMSGSGGPGSGHGMPMGMGMAHGPGPGSGPGPGPGPGQGGQASSRIPMGWQVMPSAGGSVDAEGGMTTGTSGWSGRGSGVSTPGTSLPMPPDLLPRQLTTREAQLVDHLVRLQLFLATAPSAWQQHGTVPTGSDPYSQQNPWYNFHHSPNSEPISFVSCPHPALNRFLLPNGEHVSCAYWNGLYMITGTDIVRALAFRFEAFGRPVKTLMVKKFEEGIFSDLRNLKPGEDSSLEKPKSEFLDLLFKYGCIRTQKKQKVFYWFSVPHDRLFLDALERDLKREKDGVDTTTEIIGEPARSFRWDPTKSLFEQFAASDLSAINSTTEPLEPAQPGDAIPAPEFPGQEEVDRDPLPQLPLPTGVDQRNRPFSVTLFEGSPQYKQRKKKDAKARAMKRSALGQALSDLEDEEAEGPDRLGSEYSDVKPVVDDATPEVAALSRAPSVSMPPPGPQPPMPTWKTIADESPVGRIQESHARAGSMTSESDGARGQSAAPSMPGVKMFRCPLDTCGRYFKRLEHLKRHVRTHTQERPYMCQRCGKRFSRSDNLTQHYKTHERQARGERASTQMTEDDEFARMLEAQVDQMAAELGYEGSIYGDSAASSFYGSPAMQPAAARLGNVPNLGMPAGYMAPPPPPLGRHQPVGLGMGGTSYARMSSLGPDRNSYLFRRQASIPAYPSSRARYLSPNPGTIPRSHTRSPSFRFAQPVQRAVSVSAIPQQGYAQPFAVASPYQGNNTLPPMNGGFAPGQVQQPGFTGQMPFSTQQDPYNGMPPPSSINGQAYAIGPDAMGGINPRNMMQQQPPQPESGDMSMQGMLPSASSGQSGQQASMFSQHSNANSQGIPASMDPNSIGKPPQSSTSNEGIQMPSPATMAFNGMLVSASYAPGSAVAWPTPDNQTPMPDGSRFSDNMQESG